MNRRFITCTCAAAVGGLLGGCGGRSGDGPMPGVVSIGQTVVTVAGSGDRGFSGDGGAATAARLDSPMDVVTGADGKLIIADSGNGRVRSVDLASGIIVTIAGQRDEPQGLGMPTGVTPMRDGSLIVVDWGGHQVFRYPNSGARLIVAGDGSGSCSVAVEAAPSTVSIFAPRAAAVMADGALLVSEQGCHRVRRVTTSAVEAYAGTGAAGYAGDGQDAVQATVHAGPLDAGPSFGIALSPEDPPDEMYIADTGNHVIRQIKVFTRRMETLAGTGQPGFRDGPPDEAQFNGPVHVFAGRDHSVWIADAGNHAIRYIDPLGTRVSTVVGTGTAGFNGDGHAPADTQLSAPQAVWVDADGRVFVADGGNHRIRAFVVDGTPAAAN